MWRHKTAGKNLQNNFTREWLMGFIFPGDTSPHGTGFSYASRDGFPTTSQHRTWLGLHSWAARQGGTDRSSLAAPPATSSSRWAPRRMDWAVLVCFSISHAPEAAPCPWGQSHSTHAIPTWFSLFNISERVLIPFPGRRLNWLSSNCIWTNKNLK